MPFSTYNLSEPIMRAIRALGFEQPTDVQREVIPVMLEHGQDLRVQAQTGSGKTAAYAIPLCERIEWAENKPQVLVLTPTRELAAQVRDSFIAIGRYKRVKAIAVYGKVPFAYQQQELKQKNHVVIGTPGRVMDHIRKGTLALDEIRTLVIDEADHMLNMGFIDQVEAIVRELPRERTTLLFSATYPEKIEALADAALRNPVRIAVESTVKTTELVDHRYVVVEEADKFATLVDVTVVENPASCIVFCRTQEQVDDLDAMLADLGYGVDKLHGGMPQDHRFEVIDGFRAGAFRYLIATDVAARGIDVEQVELVLNYELPKEDAAYVHRTGRTGRAGQTGRAISFARPGQQPRIAQLAEALGAPIAEMAKPSAGEVAAAQAAFDERQAAQPALKRDRNKAVGKDILKLYFNGGKKKKLRAVDFVGTLAKIDGMTADDIGIITIQDNQTFVDILNGKGYMVLHAMKTTTIKGKLLKVHVAKN